MHDIDLIVTITAGLAIAALFGYITQRIGLSPIVGYLLAGIAVGPFTPGYVANRELAQQLAEIGVVLLMFGVGLSFHIKELLAVRTVAIPGALVQSTVATLLGIAIALAFGWSVSSGLVFGLSIAVASTVVLVRVLSDNDDLHSPTGHIAVGWLVVEDLFTVVVLVVLPAVFVGGDGSYGGDVGDVMLGVALTLVKVTALVAGVFVIGGRLIPRMLERVAATRSTELFNLAVLAVALGIAVGSTVFFGVSMALGAFLAGMVVGRSDFSLRAATEVLPMRDAFAVLFFVSVGMLFDPMQLVAEPLLVAATLAIVLVGKSLAAVLIVLVLRRPLRTALAVAVALAQIGEFSFILASLGRELGILDTLATNAIVTAAIVSITLNPLLYRMIPSIERRLMASPALASWLSRRARSGLPGGDDNGARFGDGAHRAVVVGYGPVGRTVSRMLRDNHIEPVIVDMNLETVRSLREEGIAAEYGDALHPETLRRAGIADAQGLVVSVGGLGNAMELVAIARELNPRIWVFVRTTYVSELAALRDDDGVDVYSAEGEVALAITTAYLHRLGATAEQIDRERERIHRELRAPITPPNPHDPPMAA